jgi:hypothetical protein
MGLCKFTRKGGKMALVEDVQEMHDEHSRSALGRFFGVAVDPKTYGALVYMVLALATGIFYFTWAVTGLSLSISLMILIIGIPLGLLFLGSVRLISYMEGFLVSGLLGAHLRADDEDTEVSDEEVEAEKGFVALIKRTVKDARTWTSMVYMVLQLGLGILYFTFVVTALSVSLAFMVAPFLKFFGGEHLNISVGPNDFEGLPAGLMWLEQASQSGALYWALAPIGFVLFFLTLHIARGVGHVHSKLAEALLVKH